MKIILFFIFSFILMALLLRYLLSDPDRLIMALHNDCVIYSTWFVGGNFFFKAIVDLFSYEKVILFQHKNTDPTLPCQKGYFFLMLFAAGFGMGGSHCAPYRIFDSCILTGKAFKLILHDLSSNFIFNMWPVKFFWSVKQIAHTGLFVGDRQRLSLTMEL